MIQPSDQAGGPSAESPEAGAPAESTIIHLGTMPTKARLKFQPTADFIQVKYQAETKVGGVFIPGQAKPRDYVVVEVIAVGPDCKKVKAGDRVIISTNGIHGKADGILVDGVRVHFTQERVVLAVVDEPVPKTSGG
jgi:co-chaperonin GroES (HSP10)